MRRKDRRKQIKRLRRKLRLESLELRQLMDGDGLEMLSEPAESMVYEENTGYEEPADSWMYADCYYTNDCPDPVEYEYFPDPDWLYDSTEWEDTGEPLPYERTMLAVEPVSSEESLPIESPPYEAYVEYVDPWLFADCYYTNDCPDPYVYEEYFYEEYPDPYWVEDSYGFDESGDPLLYMTFSEPSPDEFSEEAVEKLNLDSVDVGDVFEDFSDSDQVYYFSLAGAAGGAGGEEVAETTSAFGRFDSAEELEQYLIDDALKRYEGLFGSETWGGWGYDYYYLRANDSVAVPTFDSGTIHGNRSETNTQVDGVDEADMIETDGEFLYIVADGTLKIIDVRDAANMSLASETSLSGYSEQMYLFGDRLAVISNQWGGGPIPLIADAFIRPGYGGPPKSHVTIFDVSDRQSPRVLTDVVIEGSVIDSRAIDGQIYLVTQSEFSLPAPSIRCDESEEDGDGTGDDANGRFARIRWDDDSTMPFDDVLRIDLAEGETEADIESDIEAAAELFDFDPASLDGEPLMFRTLALPAGGDVDGANRLFWPGPRGQHCTYVTRDEYLEEIAGKVLDLALSNVETFDGDGSLVASGLLNEATAVYRPFRDNAYSLNAVTTIAMTGDQPGVVTSTAAPLDWGSEIHVTAENLYFIATSWTADGERTNIYQFDLDNGAGQTELVAAGEVPGRILNQFAADESDGTFRIVTQEGWSNGAVSNLFVLEQNGDQLEVIGSIEDLAPNERLYSVRFLGDKAFVVTFGPEGGVWMDPLFTIDLSDPTAPTVQGELEIPGFSNYLQLIGDGYLVGLGRNADETNGRELEPQISLFDVSDFDDPQLTDRYALSSRGWSWSEAFGDHHAISYFADHGLLAVPFTTHDPGVNGFWEGERWVEPASALWLFRLNIEGENAGTIELAGRIEHDSDVRRSVRIDDVLYSLSYKELQAHSLSDLATQLGSLYLAPTASDDWFTIPADSGEQKLDVLHNDDLADETDGQPVIVGVGDSAFGATIRVSDDGRVIFYTPAPGFFGDDTFTYTIDNGSRGIDEGSVTVHVELSVDEESAENELNVLAGVDVSEFIAPVITEAEASDGEVRITDDGQRLVFTPAPNFFGWVRIEFTVAESDAIAADGEDEAEPVETDPVEILTFGGGIADSGIVDSGISDDGSTGGVDQGDGTRRYTITLRVRDIDDPATAGDDRFHFRRPADEYHLDVLHNDSPGADESDWLTITGVTQPESGGTVEVAPWGYQLIFRPTQPFDAPVSFTYTVTDQHGSTATASVTVEYSAPEGGDRMADLARAHLAERLGIPAEQISVHAIRSVEWPDSCLGSPNLDQVCAEVITPGFRVVLLAGNREYIYHTDTNETVIPVERRQREPKVRFRFEAIDENGRVVTEIPSGEPFRVKVYVQDVRPEARGFNRAFLDVLYPASIVAPFAENGRPGDPLGDDDVTGLIDELGEDFEGGEWNEDGEQLVTTLNFFARRPGDASFVANPADDIGREMLVDAANEMIDWEQVAIEAAAFRITPGWRNVDNPSDINGDGDRTASDVIVLINGINERGPYVLARGAEAIAAASVNGHYYLDPNADGMLSASDCLYVINEINGLEYNEGGRWAFDAPNQSGVPLSALVNWQAVERGLRSLAALDGFDIPVSEAIDAAYEVLVGIDSDVFTAGFSDEWLASFRPQIVSALLGSPWLADGELSQSDIGEIASLFDRVVDHFELDAIFESVADPDEIDDAVERLRDQLFALLGEDDLLSALET